MEIYTRMYQLFSFLLAWVMVRSFSQTHKAIMGWLFRWAACSLTDQAVEAKIKLTGNLLVTPPSHKYWLSIYVWSIARHGKLVRHWGELKTVSICRQSCQTAGRLKDGFNVSRCCQSLGRAKEGLRVRGNVRHCPDLKTDWIVSSSGLNGVSTRSKRNVSVLIPQTWYFLLRKKSLHL